MGIGREYRGKVQPLALTGAPPVAFKMETERRPGVQCRALEHLSGAFDFILVFEKLQIFSQHIPVESGKDLLSRAVPPPATA